MSAADRAVIPDRRRAVVVVPKNIVVKIVVEVAASYRGKYEIICIKIGYIDVLKRERVPVTEVQDGIRSVLARHYKSAECCQVNFVTKTGTRNEVGDDVGSAARAVNERVVASSA